MFQQLTPLLHNATLVLTISGSAEALTLNVIPQPIDAKADGGLKTPLSITVQNCHFATALPRTPSGISGGTVQRRAHCHSTGHCHSARARAGWVQEPGRECEADI